MENEEVIYEFEGQKLRAEYTLFDDTLTTYLPDGSNRKTELRGLKPELAALMHLKIYTQKSST
ncbi:hypothetical protein [Thalassomonas actiniarum]|uniref:Uncharacterized protein n=1 Tax=Thalassomonas actiniarum TaxID=485447 RepID=A0AAF0C3H3_9GAMM|nr:hypothetical protein [Thalassomonas actiniarum]WDD98694.1 hypothetical protein SG35_026205 [Thalassomonas actiniarum]